MNFFHEGEDVWILHGVHEGKRGRIIEVFENSGYVVDIDGEELWYGGSALSRTYG